MATLFRRRDVLWRVWLGLVLVWGCAGPDEQSGLAEQSSDWVVGDAAAASGLRLKARDLAKIGSLYLHGGRWRGRQVVPEAWVSRSSMPHVADAWIANDGTGFAYGYQWRVGELPFEKIVWAQGVGDQKLFVVPGERLVGTIFAGQYNASEPYSPRIFTRVLEARGVDLGQ